MTNELLNLYDHASRNKYGFDWGAPLRELKIIKQYAWAIPTEEAIREIVKYSPIIEIGAGTGYWAMLISQAGGKIICFDKKPPKKEGNHFCHAIEYYPVKQGLSKVLRKSKYRNYTLMLSWAPYDDDMAENCLKYFKGKYIIWIGEGDGGCCGSGEFFELLHNTFFEIEFIPLPQWFGLHDNLWIYERLE
jgi:hypothetical protein